MEISKVMVNSSSHNISPEGRWRQNLKSDDKEDFKTPTQ
jgi:hypothetical protein